MKPAYLDFSKQANAVITNVNERSKIIAIAVSIAMAQTAILPSAPVASADDFFTTQVYPGARSRICEFNENVIFNCPYAFEMTRLFWKLRYTAAHPSSNMVFPGSGFSFFEALNGVGGLVGDEFNTFCNSHSTAIFALSNLAARIFAAEEEA